MLFQRALEVNPSDKDARMWLERLSKLMVEQSDTQRDVQEQGTDLDSTPFSDVSE